MADVYLCGGFHSGWQDRVMEAQPDYEYYDPRNNPASWSTAMYTESDLGAIRESGLMFAYIEASNPGGFNAAFEIGYAVALGIPIILIVEPVPQRYYSMLVAKSHVAFQNFELALDWFANDFTGVRCDRS